LRKNHRFEWTEDADLASNKLKDSLTSSPVLRTPNFSKQFILLCDASLHGIGCVLAQVDEEGTELPIAYMSEKLSKAQQNYSVTELECLAVIRGTNKFRAYIKGQDFVVVTDHASLQWLMKQNLLSRVLYRAHDPCDSAHLSMGRMAQKLKQFFFWPGMITQIRSYISNCPTCKPTKGANLVPRPPMGRPMTSDRPFQIYQGHIRGQKKVISGYWL